MTHSPRSSSAPKSAGAPYSSEAPVSGTRPPGRPRDARIDEAALEAAIAVLADGGYSAFSIEAVAARAGVGRPAIYRRWASRQHLLVDAIVRKMGAAPAPDTGSVQRDLLAGVSTLVNAFAGPVGRALPALISDLVKDPELGDSFRDRVLRPRRASVTKALERGMARGEIRDDIDVELVLDLLAGPLYYRALFGLAPADSSTARKVVDAVMRMIAA